MTAELLRSVTIDGYNLRTWDTGRQLPDGKWLLGYELLSREGAVLFTGEDFGCSPLQAVDSDATLRAILGFLCLRFGDVEPDWFEAYTAAQMAFAEGDAEYLSLWAHETEAFEDA